MKVIIDDTVRRWPCDSSRGGARKIADAQDVGDGTVFEVFDDPRPSGSGEGTLAGHGVNGRCFKDLDLGKTMTWAEVKEA